MNGLRSMRRRRPELPLVPLIDVLVMLVFFAFVTMRFSTNQTLNITLPKVETAGKSEFHGTITIGIDKAEGISVNGKKVSNDELISILEEIKKVDRNMPVLIKADESTPLKTVTFVMDACRKTGLLKFSLQSR